MAKRKIQRKRCPFCKGLTPVDRTSCTRGHVNLYKEVECCPALTKITGTPKATRYEIVQKVWTYVRHHNLQSPQNGRLILPDAQLAVVLGAEGAPIDGFKIMHDIEKHIVKL